MSGDLSGSVQQEVSPVPMGVGGALTCFLKMALFMGILTQLWPCG